MIIAQIIDLHILDEFLRGHQASGGKYSLKKRTTKNWLSLGYYRNLCLCQNAEHYLGRFVDEAYVLYFLGEAGYLRSIPSKSTFHRYWPQVSGANLKTWIRMSGECLVTEADQDLAIDNSGFELLVGSIWRFLKWEKRAIFKSSPFFVKVHLVVALPSKAIVSIQVSESTVHV